MRHQTILRVHVKIAGNVSIKEKAKMGRRSQQKMTALPRHERIDNAKVYAKQKEVAKRTRERKALDLMVKAMMGQL